ncbi:MAG: group II truncated hemoglobin [Thiotrichaceae bacterium]|nr:group II truncated hemoglobin [Thiotrichaceae bacterium]
MTSQTLYTEIGGEETVQKLVDLFYNHMDSLPEVKETRQLHAKSLKASRKKLFKFLSGWLGGPNLYIEEYGHPRLRQRHLPFKIAQRESDQWMLCMHKAIADMAFDPKFSQQLTDAFQQMADHMINQE